MTPCRQLPQALPVGADAARFVHVAALAKHNGWRPEQFGESTLGVPLVAWWPPQAPTRMVWATMHGEEATTGALAHTLLRTIRAEDARAVIVPVVNPDGLLSATRQNARGVDLNRNWASCDWTPEPSPTFWPTTMTRSTEFRTQQSSPGASAGSEIEVQSLAALVERIEPREVVDVHAPLECVLAMHDGTEALALALAQRSGLRVQHALDAPTPGDGGSWCAERDIACITYEVEAAPLPLLWHRHAGALAHAVTGR